MLAAGAGFAIDRLLRGGESGEQSSATGVGHTLAELDETVGRGELGELTADPTWPAPTHPPASTPGWAGESGDTA
jgi:hypothetical protein